MRDTPRRRWYLCATSDENPGLTWGISLGAGIGALLDLLLPMLLPHAPKPGGLFVVGLSVGVAVGSAFDNRARRRQSVHGDNDNGRDNERYR